MAFRIEPSISVLVCSRGGGGLLTERMELVAELWKANIKVVLEGSWAKISVETEAIMITTDGFTVFRLSLFLRKIQVFKNSMNMPVIMILNALRLSLNLACHKQML